MSARNAYSERERDTNNSVEDYATITEYHSSFRDALQRWQITADRLAIVPGSFKYLNEALYDGVENRQNNIEANDCDDCEDYQYARR
jgi:hypothetical protein